MVGRCADYALAEYPGAISVFIHADLDKRIHRLAKVYNLTESAAKEQIIKSDKKRSSYYNYYTSKKWGDSASYNLCLDSGILGVEGCVEMIKAAIELKKKSESLVRNKYGCNSSLACAPFEPIVSKGYLQIR